MVYFIYVIFFTYKKFYTEGAIVCMTPATLESIHTAYVSAVQKARINVAEITKHFLDNLNQISVADEDTIQFSNFTNGVYRCYHERLKTFQMTNLCEEILFCSMHILGWLNTQGYNLDTIYSARRKGLESHFTKILHKATKNKVTNVYDLFGIRGILLNEENSIELIYKLNDTTIGILCNLNMKDQRNFVSWVEQNPNIDDFSKKRIRYILSIPFELQEAERKQGTDKFDPEDFPELERPEKSLTLYPNGVKDYIFTPKDNGYQSLHFVLRISATSSVLPGAVVEMQFRTDKMNKHATVLDDDTASALKALSEIEENPDGDSTEDNPEKADIEKRIKKSAAHFLYKDEIFELRKNFCLTKEEVKACNLRGFYEYGPETDLDGVGRAKELYNRRMNAISF